MEEREGRRQDSEALMVVGALGAMGVCGLVCYLVAALFLFSALDLVIPFSMGAVGNLWPVLLIAGGTLLILGRRGTK